MESSDRRNGEPLSGAASGSAPGPSPVEPALGSPGISGRAETAWENIASPHSSWWIDLYGLLLLAGIVAHITLAVAVFFELFFLAINLAVSAWAFDWISVIRAEGLLIVIVFLVRVGRYLWHVTWGLVTPRYEPKSELLGGIRLDRSSHQELCDAVAEAAWRVWAPEPDEIRVNYRPACCAAEFRQFAVSTQRRLVVVLGLPILTVFTVSELKVILGHELAHIGRGDTRLEVFVVRVLEIMRRKVAEIRERWWRWFDPVYWYAWGCAALLVWLLAPVRRHQELRADSLSAAAYGGDLAARTLLKDWLATHEFLQTVASVRAGSPEGGASPARNVFHRFAERWQEFSRGGHEYLERRLEEEEQPSFWDSHPTVHQRTAVMRCYPSQPGEDRRLARELLPDYDQLAEQLHDAALREYTAADEALPA